MGWAVMLRDFFHSGRAADLVLLFMAIEFVVLSRAGPWWMYCSLLLRAHA